MKSGVKKMKSGVKKRNVIGPLFFISAPSLENSSTFGKFSY